MQGKNFVLDLIHGPMPQLAKHIIYAVFLPAVGSRRVVLAALGSIDVDYALLHHGRITANARRHEDHVIGRDMA